MGEVSGPPPSSYRPPGIAGAIERALPRAWRCCRGRWRCGFIASAPYPRTPRPAQQSVDSESLCLSRTSANPRRSGRAYYHRTIRHHHTTQRRETFVRNRLILGMLAGVALTAALTACGGSDDDDAASDATAAPQA